MRHRLRLRRIAASLAVAALSAATPAQTLSGPALDGDLIFMIDSASTSNDAFINFYIRVDEGLWETDIITSAVRHGQSIHESRITGLEGDTEQFRISVSITIPPNPWGGGDAVAGYQITITRTGTTLKGRFLGHMNGTMVEGPVSGTYYPDKLPARLDPFDYPEPGEHPRLFFRKAAIPAIRERAATAAGEAILDTLRAMLARDTYTLWDGVGWGMLFIVTGDTAYADSGRVAVERAFAGEPDGYNEQYNWTDPSGALRAGPSVAAIAMAYDLCYDGWGEGFRDSVALRIQNYGYNEADSSLSLERLSVSPRHMPGSNHWGAQVGGAGLSVLAILRDPGTDSAALAGYLEQIRRHALRNLYEGFGDGGYFAEHAGPGYVSSNTAFVPYLQAERVCGGMDFITPRPNARWLSIRWAHELLPSDEGPIFPIRRPPDNTAYGTMYFDEDGTSHGGHFVQGMGAVADSRALAMAWVYEKAVAGGAAHHSYGVGIYPHRAMFALVNWPLEEAPRNPEGIIPFIRRDRIFGYYSFRNRWHNADDVIVTALTDWHLRWGYIDKHGMQNPIIVWGDGIRTTGPATFFMERTTYFKDYGSGTGVVSTIPVHEGIETRPLPGGRVTSFAVDFDRELTGVDALIVATGPKAHPVSDTASRGAATRCETVVGDNVTYQVMTLYRGDRPLIETAGDVVRIGGREVWFDGEKLVLGVNGEIAVDRRPSRATSRPSLIVRRNGGWIVVGLTRKAAVSVRVYDARGARVLERTGTHGQVRVDTRGMADGIYILRARGAGTTLKRRFAVR